MINNSIRRLCVMSVILICFAVPSAHADSAEQWQLVGEEKSFLHNPPNSFTGLYRSQGIATDGQQWFFSWQYGLERADDAFNSLQRNSNFDPITGLTPGIPFELLAQGLDHIGDIDYKDGIIYAPLDTTNGYNNGHVALYNAADLSYTGITYELIFGVIIFGVKYLGSNIWGQSKNSSALLCFRFGPRFSGLTRRPDNCFTSSLNRSLPNTIP